MTFEIQKTMHGLVTSPCVLRERPPWGATRARVGVCANWAHLVCIKKEELVLA